MKNTKGFLEAARAYNCSNNNKYSRFVNKILQESLGSLLLPDAPYNALELFFKEDKTISKSSLFRPSEGELYPYRTLELSLLIISQATTDAETSKAVKNFETLLRYNTHTETDNTTILDKIHSMLCKKTTEQRKIILKQITRTSPLNARDENGYTLVGALVHSIAYCNPVTVVDTNPSLLCILSVFLERGADFAQHHLQYPQQNHLLHQSTTALLDIFVYIHNEKYYKSNNWEETTKHFKEKVYRT